jgi:TonB family protein
MGIERLDYSHGAKRLPLCLAPPNWPQLCALSCEHWRPSVHGLHRYKSKNPPWSTALPQVCHGITLEAAVLIAMELPMKPSPSLILAALVSAITLSTSMAVAAEWEPLQQPPAPMPALQPHGSLDQLITEKIAEAWRDAPAAPRATKTILEFSMLPDGTIVGVRVISSSGNAPYDAAAIRAVQNVGRIPEVSQLDRPTFDRFYRMRRAVFVPADYPK